MRESNGNLQRALCGHCAGTGRALRGHCVGTASHTRVRLPEPRGKHVLVKDPRLPWGPPTFVSRTNEDITRFHVCSLYERLFVRRMPREVAFGVGWRRIFLEYLRRHQRAQCCHDAKAIALSKSSGLPLRNDCLRASKCCFTAWCRIPGNP